MSSRRFIAVVALLAICSFVAASVSASAGGTTFSVSITKAGPKNGGGEPSIATGVPGMLYVSWPGDKMGFTRSSDGGKTWTQGGQPKDEGSVGDTSVMSDRSGAVYETNLNVVNADPSAPNSLQISIWKSFNKGKTWPQEASGFAHQPNASNQPFFVDRQWTDAWIPPGKTTKQAIVALSYHDFVPSQIWVNVSTDGGKTFGPFVDAISDGNAEADSACSTIPGGLRIEPGGKHPGRIYVAWLAADPANPATGCNITQLQAFHDIWVAWSDDMGQTWTDQLVYDAGPLKDGSELFADLALDNRGNPYVAFTMDIENQFDVWVEGSKDGGKTWNGKTDGTGTPVKVDHTKGSHYFPAIDVGKVGHVDVAYLGTPTVIGTQPDGKPDEPAGDANANWYVYLAQTTNLFGGTPFKNHQLSPKVVHHGDICTLGIFCASNPDLNRDILDFIDVVIDGDGMAHVAFTAADSKQMKDGIYVANQTGGPSMGLPGH
jgi:hypothetical protein